jgi:hypothetical protein
MRCNAILYAPFLPKSVVKNELIHLVDLLPTFSTLANAGFKINKTIDGVDQSEILRKPFTVDKQDELRNTVHVIGEGNFYYSAVIKDDFKYVNGSGSKNGQFDSWLGSNNNTNVNADKYEENLKKSETWKAIGSNVGKNKIQIFKENSKVTCKYDKEVGKCDLLKAPCLFNIIEDPCEQNNLAIDPAYANKLKEMKDYHDQVAALTVKSRRVAPNPVANPVNWGGVWTWYMDLIEGKA